MPWLYFAMKPRRSEEKKRQFRARGRKQDSKELGQVRVGIQFKWRTVASWDCGSWILETEQLIIICGIYRWLFLTKQRLCWPFYIFHQKCITFPMPEDKCVWVRLPRLDPKLLVFERKIMGLAFLLIFFFQLILSIFYIICVCMFVGDRK